MEDLTHMRGRKKDGKRLRARRHHWAWGQLPPFVDYVDPAASTSQIRSCCEVLGKRSAHRFDVSSLLSPGAQRRECKSEFCPNWQSPASPRAAVNTPGVGSMGEGQPSLRSPIKPTTSVAVCYL